MSQLQEFRSLFRNLFVNVLASSELTPSLVRQVIYRWSGINVHTLSIAPRCTFIGSKVSIGAGTFVNRGSYFDASNKIEIHDNCAIGMEVLFCTSNHQITDPLKRGGNVVSAPIEVGIGSWIGARAIILPGVKIGRGCVIAAGAVVTRDCQDNSIYGGVPARLIRHL